MMPWQSARLVAGPRCSHTRLSPIVVCRPPLDSVRLLAGAGNLFFTLLVSQNDLLRCCSFGSYLAGTACR